MDMKSAVVNVYTNYFGFTGRAARSEFWYFVLFTLIASVVLSIVDSAIFGIGVLGGLFSLASLIPGIAVSIRRMHDIGKPGWWILIGLIPLIGALVLIYFYVQPSQAGANEYGPNPYGE